VNRTWKKSIRTCYWIVWGITFQRFQAAELNTNIQTYVHKFIKAFYLGKWCADSLILLWHATHFHMHSSSIVRRGSIIIVQHWETMEIRHLHHDNKRRSSFQIIVPNIFQMFQ
jgi:hypothetical protein